MYAVYAFDGWTAKRISSNLTKDAALAYAQEHDWMYVDTQGRYFDLLIRPVK
jgi:hypothetical protein